MQVTYNGENLPIFFENTGAPVSIQITLQFQEVKLQTRDGFTEYSQAQGGDEYRTRTSREMGDFF